jgi:DNA-directed RNA polymerase specialized sigma24 family protein
MANAEAVMSGQHDEEMLQELRRKLVGFARGQGSIVPAEDWAQTALTVLLERGEAVTDARAYAYAIVKNGTQRALARHLLQELIADPDCLGSRAAQAVLDVYFQGDADARVREFLVLLWKRPQQQRVAGLAYLGYKNKEIADLLGMKPSTARANLRHARNALKPYRDVDEHTLHYSVAGRAVWEAFQRDEALPSAPRPVIHDAWKVAKTLGVDPSRGAPVYVGHDELARRRERCLLDTARSRVLAELAWLAQRAGMMMVVTDAEAIVLWRGGERQVMRKADELGFIHGACWDMQAQGLNGISLALATGKTVTVCKSEHFVESHHDFSCIALPVRDPRDGRMWCCLNLTGTEPIVHRAIALEFDAIARRMKLRLGAFRDIRT